MESQTEYKLSDVERTLLADIEQAAQQAAQQAVAPFNAQSQAVLSLVYRQQALVGNWKLSDDKTALVKQ
jgi:hypothetical protein